MKEDIYQLNHTQPDILISKLITYSDNNGHLLNKFDEQFYLSYFDNSRIIATAREIDPSEEINEQSFIKHFLLQIEHNSNETIYLAASLKQLFLRILEQSLKSCSIFFSDFTSYLCSKIAKDDLDIVIKSIKVAKERSNPDLHKVREMDMEPVYVVSKVEREGLKMNKDGVRKNRRLEHKELVGECIYTRDSIFALGTLSPSIYEYDLDLNFKREIIPSACRESNTQIAILSLAHCVRLNRIGALVNNVGLIFWDDDFKVEKVIAKCQGDRIYYLDLLAEWVTTTHNAVHFWDIKEERISSSVVIPDCRLLNDVCEMNHLRALCVSVTLDNCAKYVLIYRERKQILRIDLGNPGAHTLHYNLATQSLLPVGYKNSVSVYGVEPRLLDVEMVGELLGHSSLITCINSVQETGVVVTGDDVGEVRVWEMNYLRCVQVIRVAKWLSSVSYKPQKLCFTDTRLNVLHIDPFATAPSEELHAIYHFHGHHAIWLVTRKDIRKVLLVSGRTCAVFVLCGHDEEVSCAVRLKAGVVVGTSRGDILHFDEDINLLWRTQGHEGDVFQIKYDDVNKFIISVGADGAVCFYEETNCTRSVKSILYKPRAVNSIEICPVSALLLLFSTDDKELSFWDYESNKLAEVITLPHEVSSVKISFPFLVIATTDGCIRLCSYNKKDRISFTLLKHAYVYDALITSMCISSNLFVGTSKGLLFCYPLAALAHHHKQKQNKTNPNRQRQYRDSYENGLKACIKRSITTFEVVSNQHLEHTWMSHHHKQSINHINILELECQTVTTLCVDGYLKIHSLGENRLLNSLNINHPLPIKWDTSSPNMGFLKNNLQDAIRIIESILDQKGYSLLKKEHERIEIQEFIKQMLNGSESTRVSEVQTAMHRVSVMSQEYTAEDYKGNSGPEPSLKALEAYKRVKLIKQANEKSLELPPISDVKVNASNKEREYFAHILSPNHLPQIQSEMDLKHSLGAIFERIKSTKEFKPNPLTHRSSHSHLKQLRDVLKEKRGWSGAENVKDIVRELDLKLKKIRKSKLKLL